MPSAERCIVQFILAAAPLLPVNSVAGRPSQQAGGLMLQGTITEGGAPNSYRAAIDLRTGFSKYSEQMGESEQHYGFDGQPWDDANGIVTVSNLPMAVARESTNAWLDKQAWQERRKPGGPLRRRVMPPHGDPVELEFDASTGLLKQATIASDDGPIIITYGDWRRLGAYTYPFHREKIMTDGERATLNVKSARVVAALPAGSLMRPRPHAHAVALTGGSTSVTFETTGRKSAHILVHGSINGKPTAFIFDTGGRNYITSDVAPQFGVTPTGGVNIGGVGESSTSGGYATVRNVSLGNAALRDEVVVIGPSFFPPAKPGAPPNPAGLTGYEFFAEYVTTIDYPARELRFSTALPKTGGVRVPFYNDGSHIYVKARIDGADGFFGIDTGDGGTVTVFPNFSARNQLEGSAEPKTNGGGVGGQVRSVAGTARRFSLGGLAFDELPIDISKQKAGAFASRSIAGNIGAGVLQCFSITIDFPNHLLLFEPAPQSPFCKPGGTVSKA